jgi:hypothetical protein
MWENLPSDDCTRTVLYKAEVFGSVVDYSAQRVVVRCETIGATVQVL